MHDSITERRMEGAKHDTHALFRYDRPQIGSYRTVLRIGKPFKPALCARHSAVLYDEPEESINHRKEHMSDLELAWSNEMASSLSWIVCPSLDAVRK